MSWECPFKIWFRNFISRAFPPFVIRFSISHKPRNRCIGRIGFLFKVQQNRLAEYKEHHKHVQPEMLDALRETGWRNYTLFIREDGLVFGYFETEESLSVAQAKMAVKEINTRWQEFMSPFTDANVRPDESFMELEEYFHLD